MPPAAQASSIDDTTAFPPPDRTVALNLGVAAVVFVAVAVALVFDWVALKGVFVVGFLSVALAYLILPLVRILRNESLPRFGWRPSRILSVLIIYGLAGLLVAPIWSIWGQKIVSQVDVAPFSMSRGLSPRFARLGDRRSHTRPNRNAGVAPGV